MLYVFFLKSLTDATGLTYCAPSDEEGKGRQSTEHHLDDNKRNFRLLYPVIPGAFSRTRSQDLKKICFFGWPRLHAS